MAALIMRAFAGMAPSANAKSIDSTIATYANNLNLRYGDFRPMPAAAALGGSYAAGGTLYKFETSGGFITKPGTVNFVRGPIPTDATERTYYTGDGAPKVTTIAADVRQLGVPQPAAAPTVVVNVVDEFSTDDSAAALPANLAYFSSLVCNYRTYTYVGLTDAEIGTTFVATTDLTTFNFKINGTLTGAVFTPTNAAHRNLIDNRLGFFLTTVGPTTTGYVPVALRGAQITYPAQFAIDLAAIIDPSDPAGTRPLMTSDQVDAVTGSLTDALKPANDNRDATVLRMKLLETEFVLIANSGSAATVSNYSAVQAFYAQADIVSSMDDAVDQAVAAIFNAMNTFNA